jgi:hypothetical protein
MTGDPPSGAGPPPAFVLPFQAALRRARDAADAALGRLGRLRERFPEALPGAVLEQLGRAPADDRRRAVRLQGGAERVVVREHSRRQGGGEVLDYGPGGLGLRLPWPVGPGAVLRVRAAGAPGPAWLAFVVRHCRRDGGGWVAGCEASGVERS